MHSLRTGAMLLSATALLLSLYLRANGQPANKDTAEPAASTQPANPAPAAAAALSASPTGTAAPTTTLGVQIVMPPVYESTTSSLGALATSGSATLKTFRSDARTLAIRAALSNALLSAGQVATTITLDKSDNDSALGEIAILCAPRQGFVGSSVSLNYLNTLVQNINAVSTPTAAPTDIASALKLLFASSNYAIADKVKVDDATIATLKTATLTKCTADLQNYAKDFYGAEMPVGALAPLATPAPGAVSSVDTFAFLGPVGTLIDTFLSILQPILIDASKIVDQARRQQAIQTALAQNQDKISATGEQLAAAVDDYATSSRHLLVGAFVEQLVSIREMSIDLSGVPACKKLAPKSRLPSGAPDAAFISCWGVAWSKLKPQVDTLNTVGDSYDTLADAGDVSAGKLFKTIMANYKAIDSGQIPISNIVLNEMTEFITFANDIANAASKSNIAALKAAASAAK